MNDSLCIFCKIARHEIPAKIIFEDENVIAFEDLKPQAPVHILIIPKIHIAKISDLTPSESIMAGRLVDAANNIAKAKGVDQSGYRLIFNCNKDAGQEVFHIHLHLLGGRKFNWPPG